MRKMVKEFQNFALRGNVLEVAVAVIMGGAFGKIVSSLVDDVLMPPLGLLLGKVDFKDLKIVLQKAQPALMEGGKMVKPEVPAVTLNYGMFIQNIIYFLIIALVIFLMVKLSNQLRKKKEGITEKQHVPSPEETLLREIRDLLKEKQQL